MPDNDQQRKQPPERLRISLTQVLGSLLAAMSAAVVCSFFGLAGTVIGAAIASAFATAGSAVYSHSLRTTRARIVNRLPAPEPPARSVVEPDEADGPETPEEAEVRRGIAWKWIGAVAAGVFILAMSGVTLIELGAGGTLHSLLDGSSGSGGGTTVSHIFTHQHARSGIPPTTTPSSPSPSRTSTPSLTPTPTPTPTPTHTTPSPTASPSHTSGSTTTVTVTSTPSTSAPPPTSSSSGLIGGL